MKRHALLTNILAGAILALVFLSGYLNSQRKVYRQHNRELIIRNDSIMSVNIRLRKALEINKGNPGRDSIIDFKTTAK